MATNSSTTGRAVLLIDFQHDFLAADGRMPVDRSHVEPVLAAAGELVRRARDNGDLVIKIGNEFKRTDVLGNLARRGAAIQGSPGARWDPRIDASDAVYLPKWKGDAFCNPALEDLLEKHQIEEVALAGLYARACVTATAKGALARGYKVDIVGDAVACRNDRTRARSLARLSKRGAHLI